MKEQPIFSEIPPGKELQLANSVTGSTEVEFVPDGSEDILRALGVFGGELLEKGVLGGAELSEDLRKSAVGYSDAAYKFVQESNPELAKRLAGPKEELDAFLETNPRAWDTLATSINMGLVTGGNPFGFATGAGLGYFRKELTGLQEGLESDLKSGMRNKSLGDAAELAGITTGYLFNAGGVAGKALEALRGAGLGLKTSGSILGGVTTAALSGEKAREAGTPLDALGTVAKQTALGATVFPAIIGGVEGLAQGAKLAGKVADSGFAKASEIVTRMTEGISRIKQKGAVVQRKAAEAEAAAGQRMQAQAMEAQFRAVEEATARQQQNTFIQERIRETQAGEMRPTFRWMDNVGMSGQKQQAQAVADGITVKLLKAPNAETIFKDKAISEVQELVDTLVSDQFTKTVEKSAKRQQFSRLMQRNMQEVRSATKVGELEQRMESLQAQYQKVANTLNPNLNTPVTDFQKQAADEILGLKSQLDEVIQATNEGVELPDIPVVREMQERQAVLLNEAKQKAISQIDDEIARVEGEASQIREKSFDTFNEKFRQEAISYDDARRGRQQPEVEYNQKIRELAELDEKKRALEIDMVENPATPSTAQVDGNDVQAVLGKQIAAKEQRLSNVRKMQVTKRAKRMRVEGEVEELITQAQELQNEMDAVRGEYLGELKAASELAYQATQKQVDALKKIDNISLSEAQKYQSPGGIKQETTISSETGDLGINIKLGDVVDDSSKLLDEGAELGDEVVDEAGEAFGADDLAEIDGKELGLDGEEVIVKVNSEGKVKEIDIKKPTESQKKMQVDNENPKSKVEREVVGTFTTREGKNAVYSSRPLESVGAWMGNMTKPLVSMAEDLGLKGLVAKLNKMKVDFQSMHLVREQMVAAINESAGLGFKSFDQVKKFLNKKFAKRQDLDFENATYEDLKLDDETVAVLEGINKYISDFAEYEVNGTKLKDLIGWNKDIKDYIARHLGDYEDYRNFMKNSPDAHRAELDKIYKVIAEGKDPSQLIYSFNERLRGKVPPELKRFYSNVGDAYDYKIRQLMEMKSKLDFFEGHLGKDTPPISETLGRFIEREAPQATSVKKAAMHDGLYKLFRSELREPNLANKALTGVNKIISKMGGHALSGASTMALQIVSAPRLAFAFDLASFTKSFATVFDKHMRSEHVFEMVKDMEALPTAKGFWSFLDRASEVAMRAPVALTGGIEQSLARGTGFFNFEKNAKAYLKKGRSALFQGANWVERGKLLYGEDEFLRLVNKFGDPEYNPFKADFDQDVLTVGVIEASDRGGMVFSKADVAPALIGSPQTALELVERNMAMFTSFVAKNSRALKVLVVDEAKTAGKALANGDFATGSKALGSALMGIVGFYGIRNAGETMMRYMLDRKGAELSANLAGADPEEAKMRVSTQQNFDSYLFDQYVSSASPTVSIMNLRRNLRASENFLEGDMKGLYEAFWSAFAGKGSTSAMETIGDTAGAISKMDNPFDPALNPSAKNIPVKWMGALNYSVVDPMIKGVSYEKGFDQERRFERQLQESPVAKDLKGYEKIQRMVKKGIPPELIMNDMSKAEALYKKLSDKSYMESIQRGL